MRTRTVRPFALGLALLATVVVGVAHLHAQVTTATLLGHVHDTTEAVLPGAVVVARQEATGIERQTVSNERGEFVMTALPTGPYSITIEMPGFKTYTQHGLVLMSGQNVQQTFTLEVGTTEETITVEGSAPLVETAASSQSHSLGTQDVRELPIARRNVTNLLGVVPGVTASSSGTVQMNGVAGGGTGVTVDGTDANSNPETRSLSQYGSQNQISVMSLDAIAEVQVIKGVLPAEYGGVAGGQVNLISRSGTNRYAGSAFYNLQDQALNARPFFTTGPRPTGTFNQYGGTLGGPIRRNRIFFFTTYEGYRERAGVPLSGTVPTQETRDALLAALPFPETKIALDTLPQPTEPIVSSSGVLDTRVGRYRGLGTRRRSEDHVLLKGDIALSSGARATVTYTRMRPWTLEPRFNVNGSNDRVYPNDEDRVAAQFVWSGAQWVSETRLGWNHTYLNRLDQFFTVHDPNNADEIGAFGRRIGLINISGLFSTPSAETYQLTGGAWSLDEKVSLGVGRHFFKMGVLWERQNGNKLSPQNPQFRFQSLADALANTPQSITISFGAPPYKSHIDSFGGFIQDDWRVGSGLVLNLGLRYDYYDTISVTPTSAQPAEIVNLAPPTDLRRLDFGAQLDPKEPYKPDALNLGPRLGFAWTLSEDAATVLRGGVGYLYSPNLPATVRQSVGDPYVGFRTIWNRTEVATKGLKWPFYNDDARDIVVADAAGHPTIFSVFDPNLAAPYTIQSMLSLEKGLGRAMVIEIGYVRTDGRDFPLQRSFAQAFDRETGARPNPDLGAPGGYYVDSSQTMEYNGLQTSLTRRFADRYAFTINYTLSKGTATQGGDLAAYYVADIGNTQDFWDPQADYGPTDNDVRHRLNGTFIYELPGLHDGHGWLNSVVGGWQIAGLLSAESGGVLTVTQPSGIDNSRPDEVSGVPLVVSDWKSTCSALGCNYLNVDAFQAVPVSPITNATLRPGTYKVGDARGPASWRLDTSFSKNFHVNTGTRLQIRADVFNLFNTKQWNNPNTNLNSSDFGRITGAGGARSMQVGARFTF
jgi:outer membrane receptor protein involved in Fe transport